MVDIHILGRHVLTVVVSGAARLAKIESRIDNLKKYVGATYQGFDNALEKVERRLTSQSDLVNAVEKRLARLESILVPFDHDRIDGLFQSLARHMSEAGDEQRRVSVTLLRDASAIARLDEKLAALESAVSGHERNIADFAKAIPSRRVSCQKCTPDHCCSTACAAEFVAGAWTCDE